MKNITLKNTELNFDNAECLYFGEIEIYYENSKSVLVFQNECYEFPFELVNKDLEISFMESDNDYQDFPYITINDTDYLYHYNNNDLILTPIEVYFEGEYIFYKEI